MDWIHCNRCFSQDTHQTVYVFSNCSHIFCNRCYRLKPNYCFSCEQQCKVVKISDNMPANLQPIFTDFTNSLDLLSKTMRIQTQQRINLVEFYKNDHVTISKKYDCLRKAYMEVRTKYKQKDDDIKKLQLELERLRAENDRMKTLVYIQQNTVVTSKQTRQTRQTKRSKDLKQNRILEKIANMTVVSESNTSARRSQHSLGGFGPYYPQCKKKL